MSVLFTNNARAECTMNEKFSILHESARAECLTNFVFISLLCAKFEKMSAVTKTHVIDFDQSRAWILYSERRSYIGTVYQHGNVLYFLINR